VAVVLYHIVNRMMVVDPAKVSENQRFFNVPLLFMMVQSLLCGGVAVLTMRMK
jgi:hypothetical protein